MNVAIKETRDYLQSVAELYWFLHTKTNIEAIAGLATHSDLGYECPYALSGMKILCQRDKESKINEEIGRLLSNVNEKFKRMEETEKNEELLTLIENP